MSTTGNDTIEGSHGPTGSTTDKYIIEGQDVESILKLLVTDDLSSIRSQEALRLYFLKYLHALPPKFNSEILSVLIAIVKKSVFHLESARGLLFACIDYITSEQKISAVDNGHGEHSASSVSLTKHFSKEWINLLIAHSCDVEELKSILKFSRKDPSLLEFIQQANIKQRNRPNAFFAFPGTKGSMLSLPPFQKWPTQLGWSFSTWFFLEPKAFAQPYLYNFKTGKSGLGYSAHFTGNCLVLTSIRVKGKGVLHCVAYEFPSYKWIHCAITYHNKWRSSDIKVYVNGQLTANIDMPWQVQTNEFFDKCFIGGSGAINHNDRTGDLNCFSGQMSAIYLFNESLSATHICALHRLGPSYMGQFKYSNESHVNLPPQICKTLYEEKLAASLFCLFTPTAVDSGTLCIQLAPFKSSTSASAQNYFVSAPHAALLGETKAIITQPIRSTLQSLGFSRSLLPLLDTYAQRGDSDACTSLIGFICDLLESSPHWFANEIIQNNGFVLVACSLATNARKLLTERLLDIFLNLTRTLISTSSTASDSLLLKHLLDNILFNPSLWIYAETKIQIKLYNYLAIELLHGTRHGSNRYTISSDVGSVSQTATAQAIVSDETQARCAGEQLSQSSIVSDLLFGEIRRVSTVLQSLHALKYYYWMIEEKGINHKAKNHQLRPSIEDLKIIRAQILAFTRELIARANVTPLDETQGLLNYLSSCAEADNLVDVLDTLSSLLLDHPIPMVAALDQKHGIRVLMTLIGSTNELIRIKSIRLLSVFLSQCSYKKKQDIMGPYNLVMLLCDRLRAYRPMSLELYEALVDLMIEENHPDRKPNDPDRYKEIARKSIVNSTIIKVIAGLIHDEKARKLRSGDCSDEHSLGKSSVNDTRRLFISDLWNLVVNSRDNRRIILQMSVWQHWLINLIISTVDDSPLVRDQVLAIFRVLLYHAIRYEYGGWRVWIDTLAIIHSKVSFDEFCLQMNKDHADNNRQHSEISPQNNNLKHDTQLSDKNDENQKQQVEKKEDKARAKDQAQDSVTSTSEDTSPSKQAAIVSSISEHILNESRGIEIDEDANGIEKPIQVAKDEPDTRAANSDQQSEGKDMTVSVSSKVAEVNDVDDGEKSSEEVNNVARKIDSLDLAPSRAFRKKDVNGEISVGQESSDQSLAHAGSTNELDRQQSLTSIVLDETNPISERGDNATARDVATEKQAEIDHDDENDDDDDDDDDSSTLNDNQSTLVGDVKIGGEPQSSLSSNSNSLHSNKAHASPAFRIPEFKWGGILVKLLNDLMFSIECDLYHWRCLANLTSLDAPPYAPKTSFASQTQASSSNSGGTSSQVSAASHLLQIEAILQKDENQIYIINVIHLVSQLADNIIISTGGLLPLLAEATGGARASTSSTSSSSNSSTSNNDDAANKSAASVVTCEGLTLAQANSLLYRLASLVDMVIFAAPHVNLGELEADKNTTSGGILRQCLRLACTVTVKNCLILRSKQAKMSSNDGRSETEISNVEFSKEMFDSYQGCSLLSANGLFEYSALTLDHTDLIANLEYSPNQTPNTSSMPSLLPFQTTPIRDPNKLLQALDISRIQACIYHTGSAESRQSQFLALSSLYFISVLMVSKYRDIIEPKHKTPPTRRKSRDSSSPTGTGNKETTETQSTDTNTAGVSNSAPISSVEANLLTFGKMQPNSSGANSTGTNVNSSDTNSLTNMLTSKLENTLDSICPLLKSIMCDFCQFLSKTLLGSHGQDLVLKEADRTFRRQNTSPVELVMLLCSQEWQNTLQKNAGLAFIELINEGRVLSHGMKDHIVRVAMEAEFILSRLRADDVAKHEHFGLACSETLSARLHEEVLINSLISSAARRDHVLYSKFKESLEQEWDKSYKLDIWEDDDRRKRRFVIDSWTNSSQLFYIPPSSQNQVAKLSSDDSAFASESQKDDVQTKPTNNDSILDSSKRILDLQKTIELGGLSEHCSPSANAAGSSEPVSGELSGGGGDFDVEDDGDDDEDEDDEADDEEDVDDPCEESNSPHSDSANESAPQGAAVNEQRSSRSSKKVAYERNQHGNKRSQVLNLKATSSNNKSAASAASSSTASAQASGHREQDNKQPEQNVGAHQNNWDYEDYGSVNDFTGSVIFAAEASLAWSIYTVPGVMQITTNELYFEPSQNVTDSIDALKRELQDKPADNNVTNTSSCSISDKQALYSNNDQLGSTELRRIDLLALRYCDFLTNSNGKIQLADIRAIFSRHYLLQPNALEIFIAQRTSVMFAFADFDTVKRVVKYLPPVGVGIKYGISQSRRASLMSPRQLFAASNMTQRWQRREIGNFQYLMFLNTIAGRTYQDLNQYPVFPWILTNYESDELDLTLPTNFRDLSKPVGALNTKRRDEFIERYQSWDNPKVPAFHYGTHYSTAAFTLNWLSRLRGQFNSSYLALQDGKYEEESRLFLSIGDSWVSSLIGGQQNVKELTPEFFYLPEMFHSNFGLPEVELPPWAKRSAEQFVRIHRIALESELVSCQLHQWIDLIFGYKQRGPEAINSVNTFYYLTYQGNVNLNMIKDPSLREAIETQIKHFGQTPSQLTTEPHPPRFSALHAAPMTFHSNVDDINRVVKFPSNHSIVHISSCIHNYIAAAVAGGPGAADSQTTGTVQQATSGVGTGHGTAANSSSSVHSGPSSVLTITSNNQYQIHKWHTGEQLGHPLSLDPQLESANASLANTSLNRRQLIDVDDFCSNVFLNLTSSCDIDSNAVQEELPSEVQWPCSRYIVTLDGKYIIMGSFYDNSFRVFTTESGKLCQVIYGHRAPITCLVRSEGNAVADFYIATGSLDCNLLIWFWNERYAQVEGSGVSAVHNPLPKLSITGHQTPVLSALISAELGLIISGSKNLILVHTLTTGESLLEIDVKLPTIAQRTLQEGYSSASSQNANATNSPEIQRPQVDDRQKTILEASMLGDPKDQQRALKRQSESNNNCPSISSQTTTASTLSARDERISHLIEICSSSDYYVTNLQLARELAFIVCVALPAPRKRANVIGTKAFENDGNVARDTLQKRSSLPPALLMTFNLKGSLMDSAPIGLATPSSSPKLGDTCVTAITRDGEHLILNDSPYTLKIYKTFGLQPMYAYNTNDVYPSASAASLSGSGTDNSRIRSLALLDHRYILVGLDNGKLIIYNCDFKNLQ